ncbi:MAG: metallophosphoesterase [Candidatus Lambdaproteobacteria bacterium]|nr:metallophosphoesterase [Candidatus Lambdaproteobacteria bacterium]
MRIQLPRLAGVAAAVAVLAGLFVAGLLAGLHLDALRVRLGCYDLPAVLPLEVPLAAPERVRFAAVGDVGMGNADQARVAAALREVCAREGCDFTLLLGDNIYPDGVRSLADPRLRTVLDDLYGPPGKPVLAVLGNHDVHGDPLPQVLHSLRSATWRMPSFRYDFRAGPARFHATNTNCGVFEWRRLAGRLRKEEEGWTVVFGHHPVYAVGAHGDGEAPMRWYWEARLAGRVDLYLSGHDHTLEHLTRPGGRTDYLVAGAGAQPPAAAVPAAHPRSAAEVRFAHGGGGFAWVEITPERLRWRFHDAAGRVLHAAEKVRPAR